MATKDKKKMGFGKKLLIGAWVLLGLLVVASFFAFGLTGSIVLLRNLLAFAFLGAAGVGIGTGAHVGWKLFKGRNGSKEKEETLTRERTRTQERTRDNDLERDADYDYFADDEEEEVVEENENNRDSNEEEEEFKVEILPPKAKNKR